MAGLRNTPKVTKLSTKQMQDELKEYDRMVNSWKRDIEIYKGKYAQAKEEYDHAKSYYTISNAQNKPLFKFRMERMKEEMNRNKDNIAYAKEQIERIKEDKHILKERGGFVSLYY